MTKVGDTKRTAGRPRSASPRIALSLAGGGPLGAIYEIGAMCALDEALDGISFTELDHYIGVSAGAFIAAALVNGMTPRELCKSFIDNDDAEAAQHADRFDPAWLMRPAVGELARRTLMFPGLALGALWKAAVQRKSLMSAIERLGAVLPTGVFSNEGIHERLAEMFSRAGPDGTPRSNDFRELRRLRGSKLTLVATNLDSAEATFFGSEGWDHVPISRAVQASSALPGLFPPVEIDDQSFVDGALKKTLHASVALQDGVDLVICLNPLVPFDATASMPAHAHKARRVMQRGLPKERQYIPRISQGGLPAVLSQTFRAMIHSRLEMGMKGYEYSHPQTDIVLFEPDPRDPELYLANTFSYSQRRAIAEHAYQQTRAMLRSQLSTLGPKLARHGITINRLVLQDPKRQLVLPVPPATQVGRSVVQLQETLRDLEGYTLSQRRQQLAAA
jgi:NTE family protein